MRSVLLGAVVLAFIATLYGVALGLMSEEAARASAFIGLVAANLALIFVSRSASASISTLLHRPNAIFWSIAAGAALALALCLYAPAVSRVFRFAPPAAESVAVAVAGTIATVLLAGVVLRRRSSAQL